MIRENTASYWDNVYRRAGERSFGYDGWLDGIDIHEGGRILDMGSGSGRNVGYLLSRGAVVSACDISVDAIAVLKSAYPQVAVRIVDIRAPLPYQDAAFDMVCASLCLHYFDWRTTTSTFDEISRILSDGGCFVFQVNSNLDVGYGAGEGEELEPGYYCNNGHYKRFFTKAMLTDLLSSWEVITLERRVIDSERARKHVFFGHAKKRKR